jgi:hypothetical protein
LCGHNTQPQHPMQPGLCDALYTHTHAHLRANSTAQHSTAQQTCVMLCPNMSCVSGRPVRLAASTLQRTPHTESSTPQNTHNTRHRASTEHRAQSTEHRAHSKHRAHSTDHKRQSTTHFSVCALGIDPVCEQLQPVNSLSSVPSIHCPVYRQFTVQCTVNSLSSVPSIHCPMYRQFTVQCTVNSLSSVPSIHCPVYRQFTVQCTVNSLSSVPSIHCPVYRQFTVQCTVNSLSNVRQFHYITCQCTRAAIVGPRPSNSRQSLEVGGAATSHARPQPPCCQHHHSLRMQRQRQMQ